MGYESEAVAAFDISHLAEGGRAGIACMGKTNELMGVMKRDGKTILYRGNNEGETELKGVSGNKTLYLRLTLDISEKQLHFAYSTDNKTFTPAGEPFFVNAGFWKGIRFAIYHYNVSADNGYVTLPWVRYEVKK